MYGVCDPPPVGEDAAAQVGAQLAKDEVGQGSAALAEVVQEGVEMGAYDLMQDRRLGISAAVAGALGAGRTVGGGPGGMHKAHRAMRGKPGAGPGRGGGGG